MSGFLFACYLALLLLLLVFQTSNCKDTNLCAPSCGNHNISYPFSLESDPSYCGKPHHTLHCEKNISTVLYLKSRKYYVQAINYNNLTIRVVDSGVIKNDCSSLPNFTLTYASLDDFMNPYTWFQYKKTQRKRIPRYKLLPLSQMMIFISCGNPVNSPLYVDTGTCLHGAKSSNVSPLMHSYVNVAGMKASELMKLCSLERMTLLPAKAYKNTSFKEIHSQLAYGFELSWHKSKCGSCATICYIDDSNQTKCAGSSWLEITEVVLLCVFLLIERSVSLSWEKLHEISVGVAHGIEYLHRGCEMQILHFDIKPHNILLDEHFTPKVSDFGLARLCPTNESLKSLTAAGGTIGYMAPELFYKNIGRTSYKADVYSFGMLLLEMAGRRKNLNVLTENSSQIYWPDWVHDQVSNEKAIEIGDGGTEEEEKIVKKMIIAGLWCIQMNPMNRPAMNEVVEMLEGDMESLQLPPKPVLNLYEKPMSTCGESSSMSDYSTESVSLIENAYN